MTKNLERAIACIDKEVASRGKTSLTFIEYIIWGIVDYALYILSDKEYQELKQYIYDRYGYNVGGAIKRKE